MNLTADGEDGSWRAVESEYRAIVLDVYLPGSDRFSVLENVRAKGSQDAGAEAHRAWRAGGPDAGSEQRCG